MVVTQESVHPHSIVLGFLEHVLPDYVTVVEDIDGHRVEGGAKGVLKRPVRLELAARLAAAIQQAGADPIDDNLWAGIASLLEDHGNVLQSSIVLLEQDTVDQLTLSRR